MPLQGDSRLFAQTFAITVAPAGDADVDSGLRPSPTIDGSDAGEPGGTASIAAASLPGRITA